MATPRLVPVNVTAKVVQTETQVPALAGAAFNRDSVIEPGVHLHWALPDALIRAKVEGEGPAAEIFFPGVPDLWLVLRFDPPSQGATRQWHAWVVDAITRTATPLESWTSPARAADQILTATGVLPAAADVGRPGWGRWSDDGAIFDPSSVAYYPECRNRFGFHDSLEDLAQPAGNVTYTVVGWYALAAHDPLVMAASTEAAIVDRKLGSDGDIDVSAYEVVATMTSATAAERMTWQPATLQITGRVDERLPHVTAARQPGQVELFTALDKRLRDMVELFPSVDTNTGANATDTADGVTPATSPQTIVCHGSVMRVSLGAAPAAPAAFSDGQVRLYPSVKRAMADVAARASTDNRLDVLEMLLQNLDAKRNATSEIVDLPGAAHELTFQSVPGKSTFYARIEIADAPPVEAAERMANRTGSAGVQLRPGGGFAPGGLTVTTVTGGVSAQTTAAVWRQVGGGTATDLVIAAWQAEVRAALAGAVAAAADDGLAIESRFVRVQDHRPNAQPLNLGRSSDGAGPDQAGWWLDSNSDAELRELYLASAGARIRLPDANNLYEAAGPRWHRPWAPTAVLYGTKRSYRFGFDDRFSTDGTLATRTPGQFLAAITVPSHGPVLGRSLLANGDALRVPELPLIIRPLAAEAALLDEDNASMMAAAAGNPAAVAQFRAAVQALWLTRKLDASEQVKSEIQKIGLVGELPSPVAFTAWEDPRDPVLLDVKYSHRPSSMADDWHLEPDRIECTRRVPGIVMPETVVDINERTRINYSVVKVLKSQLVTRLSIGPTGKKTYTQSPPPGVNATTYDAVDVVSAPLTGFDPTIFDRGLRERTGFLYLNYFDLIDTFGFVREWSRGAGPVPGGDPPPPYVAELHPRLPYWARLHFRLQSAAEAEDEATVSSPPVIGILLPDFLEHALEVYDQHGRALGQISAPRPITQSAQAMTMRARFDVHPWVAADLGLAAGADPLAAIGHPVLRAFVEAIVSHDTDVPANVASWYETALTAFLRVVDTVRGTLDPSRVTPDSKAKLIGEPILLLAARVRVEATSAAEPSALAEDPPALGGNPPLPSIPVRIGDVTRPDDGVLGCFEVGATAQASRVVPVSAEAADKAIVNALSELTTSGWRPAVHPFIAQGRGTTFELPVNEALDVVILADPRGALYATSGVLPRKRITMPEEFVRAAFRNMEPTFRVGPVLATGAGDFIRALIPPPKLKDLGAEFVYRSADESSQPVTFPETPLTPVPPSAELPIGRAVLAEGWVRVFQKKS